MALLYYRSAEKVVDGKGSKPQEFRRWHKEEPSRFDHKKDRKSTRLNSSHLGISYAVFCLKKKKKIRYKNEINNKNYLANRGNKILQPLDVHKSTKIREDIHRKNLDARCSITDRYLKINLA